MGLEGKDLVKRDLKRKVKGLVIPHKIDFSNKKIKRWKSPEKNDEDLVKKSMKKEETWVMKADGKEMKSRKFMGRSRSKGKVEDMIIFHLEQESEKSAPPITNQYNFAREVRAMFVFWNRVLALILFVLTSRLEYEKLSLMLSYYKNGAVL